MIHIKETDTCYPFSYFTSQDIKTIQGLLPETNKIQTLNTETSAYQTIRFERREAYAIQGKLCQLYEEKEAIHPTPSFSHQKSRWIGKAGETKYLDNPMEK